MRIPSAIQLHKASKTLTLRYGEDSYDLPAEFLRVHSPSAEVQGHGNPVLQYGKLNVGLVGVEPAGQYALKLSFDDGHDSGLSPGTTCTSWRPARTSYGPTTWRSWPAPASRATPTSRSSS